MPRKEAASSLEKELAACRKSMAAFSDQSRVGHSLKCNKMRKGQRKETFHIREETSHCLVVENKGRESTGERMKEFRKHADQHEGLLA